MFSKNSKPKRYVFKAWRDSINTVKSGNISGHKTGHVKSSVSPTGFRGTLTLFLVSPKCLRVPLSFIKIWFFKVNCDLFIISIGAVSSSAWSSYRCWLSSDYTIKNILSHKQFEYPLYNRPDLLPNSNWLDVICSLWMRWNSMDSEECYRPVISKRVGVCQVLWLFTVMYWMVTIRSNLEAFFLS